MYILDLGCKGLNMGSVTVLNKLHNFIKPPTFLICKLEIAVAHTCLIELLRIKLK